MEERPSLSFRFAPVGKFIPILFALFFIVIAATHGSNVSGYTVAFFLALVCSIPFAKEEQAYGQAVIHGLCRPMFAVIALAVILAAIAGKLISASGLVQTIAAGVVSAGFSGSLFVGASFLITCLISFATGTSVGSYMIVIPILYPVGIMAGADPAFLIGAIVSGAAFGDNLAPISDTTIASAGTQGADMGGVVRTRCRYSIPAALAALVVFLLFGGGGGSASSSAINPEQIQPKSLVMLLVPLVIIALCLLRKHLITALCYGCLTGFVVGLAFGLYDLSALLSFPGGFKAEGLILDAITGALPTVAMLLGVFSMLGVMECSGVFDSLGSLLQRFSRGVRSTEGTIVLTTGILGMLTGVIAVAEIAIGDLVKALGQKHGVDPYRRANLMDCAGVTFCFLAPWTVHCVMPSQLASQIEGMEPLVPTMVATHNFYAIAMALLLLFSILTGYARDGEGMLQRKKLF